MVEHKLNDEQKEEFKSEIGHAADDLTERLDKVFADMDAMKRNCTYAIVGAGVVGFVAGIAVGRKSLCQE